MESLSGQPRLAVVLVNWRGADDSIECLESLLRSQIPLRIIVCDNASGDGSIDTIKAWAEGSQPVTPKSPALAHLTTPPVAKPIPLGLFRREEAERTSLTGAGISLVETGANLGFAGGNNVGLKMALSDPAITHIWFLNNDTVVEAETPAAMLCAFQKDASIGMVGSVVRFYYRPDRLQLLNGSRYSHWTGRGYPIAGNAPVDTPCDPDAIAAQTSFVCGASLAVSREFAETIGGMEEGYFLYYEEIDWAVRGRQKFHIGFAPDAVVYHKEGGSIGSSRNTARRSAMSEYYMARSKILFGRKHARGKVAALVAHNLLLAFRRVTQGHFDKAAAIVKGSFNMPFNVGR